MSRSSYTDDYGDEFPGQLELFRANVERSIHSKKGQARLRELRDALMAMPVKALAADVFLAPSGEACALGVWADRYTTGETHAKMQAFEGDDDETFDILNPLGWPRLVVLEVVYQNDEAFVVSDAHRYTRMLTWVNQNIKDSDASPADTRTVSAL